jgi:hypothetical protein
MRLYRPQMLQAVRDEVVINPFIIWCTRIVFADSLVTISLIRPFPYTRPTADSSNFAQITFLQEKKQFQITKYCANVEVAVQVLM